MYYSLSTMERDETVTDEESIGAAEAQDSLDTIDKMQKAGARRGATPRWFALGIALIVAVGFALYAQEAPGDFPGIFIALGVALFVATSRNKSGASSKAIPESLQGILALVAVSAFLVVLFFGGIYLRRAYDLVWLPIVTGVVAGLTIYLIAASERRSANADG